MICKKCKAVKPMSEMYSDHTGIHNTCNKCKRKDTDKSVDERVKSRKEFVKKFNKMFGVAK